MLGSSKKKDVEKALEGVDFTKHKYQLELDTTQGKIVLDMWPDVAPGHVRNMLGLAKIGFYDNVSFHRVIAGFVIQGGCPKGTGTGGPGYTVNAEFNTRKHEAGVLSMARTADPNSAGSQFFLCLGRVPHLDNQYTGFGIAADPASLDVILSIGKTDTDEGDHPLQPITIKTAKVLEQAL